MIDIQDIRRNPDRYKYAARAKRVPISIDELLEVDVQRRDAEREVQQLREA
jgi:seryl-tRNA synthetase